MLHRSLLLVLALSLSACSSWVYRIDIPQGNYLEKTDIEKLQVGMTKEQVKYVLGSPVVVDSFEPDRWHYVYQFKSGRNKEFNTRKDFIMVFKDNLLVSASGDFELSENFNTPYEN